MTVACREKHRKEAMNIQTLKYVLVLYQNKLAEFSNFHFVQGKITLLILSNIFMKNKSKMQRQTGHVTGMRQIGNVQNILVYKG